MFGHHLYTNIDQADPDIYTRPNVSLDGNLTHKHTQSDTNLKCTHKPHKHTDDESAIMCVTGTTFNMADKNRSEMDWSLCLSAYIHAVYLHNGILISSLYSILFLVYACLIVTSNN